MLLTIPGRSTGTPRTVPITYFDYNGGYLVVGTGMGGSTAAPQWLQNLQVAGVAHVRLGGRQNDFGAPRDTLDAVVARADPAPDALTGWGKGLDLERAPGFRVEV